MKKLVTGMVSLAALAVALWGIPVASYSGAANALPQIHNRWIQHSHHAGGGDDHGGGDHNNGGGDDHGGGGGDDHGGGDHNNGGSCEDDKGKGGKHCHGVPEPSTLALFTLGLAGISVSNLARRRRVKV